MANSTKHIPSHVYSARRTHLSSSDMKEFVFFSEQTKGGTGKAVRIKIDLFVKFASLIDPGNEDGRVTIRQIESLRNSAGVSSGSLNNVNSAFKYMHKVKNMLVYYSILNDAEGTKKQAVFITDIRPGFAGRESKTGLYSVDSFDGGVSPEKSTDLSDKNVYVSGNTRNILEAEEYAHKRMANVDAIFYSSQDVINDLGVWTRSGQSQHTKRAVNELARLFQLNSDKHVFWAAEGEGVSMVNHALDETSSKFDKHAIRLIDPVADTPKLLQKIKSKGMKVGGGYDPDKEMGPSPVTYTGERRASQILKESHIATLLDMLKKQKALSLSGPFHREMIKKLSAECTGNKIQSTQSSMGGFQCRDNLPKNLRGSGPTLSSAGLTFVGALSRI